MAIADCAEISWKYLFLWSEVSVCPHLGVKYHRVRTLGARGGHRVNANAGVQDDHLHARARSDRATDTEQRRVRQRVASANVQVHETAAVSTGRCVRVMVVRGELTTGIGTAI